MQLAQGQHQNGPWVAVGHRAGSLSPLRAEVCRGPGRMLPRRGQPPTVGSATHRMPPASQKESGFDHTTQGRYTKDKQTNVEHTHTHTHIETEGTRTERKNADTEVCNHMEGQQAQTHGMMDDVHPSSVCWRCQFVSRTAGISSELFERGHFFLYAECIRVLY